MTVRYSWGTGERLAPIIDHRLSIISYLARYSTAILPQLPYQLAMKNASYCRHYDIFVKPNNAPIAISRLSILRGTCCPQLVVIMIVKSLLINI
jgi:hypothetical protein